jgi:hypothetical protein
MCFLIASRTSAICSRALLSVSPAIFQQTQRIPPRAIGAPHPLCRRKTQQGADQRQVDPVFILFAVPIPRLARWHVRGRMGGHCRQSTANRDGPRPRIEDSDLLLSTLRSCVEAWGASATRRGPSRSTTGRSERARSDGATRIARPPRSSAQRSAVSIFPSSTRHRRDAARGLLDGRAPAPGERQDPAPKAAARAGFAVVRTRGSAYYLRHRRPVALRPCMATVRRISRWEPCGRLSSIKRV